MGHSSRPQAANPPATAFDNGLTGRRYGLSAPLTYYPGGRLSRQAPEPPMVSIILSAVTGWILPCSETIPWISLAGVTSNAGE